MRQVRDSIHLKRRPGDVVCAVGDEARCGYATEGSPDFHSFILGFSLSCFGVRVCRSVKCAAAMSSSVLLLGMAVSRVAFASRHDFTVAVWMNKLDDPRRRKTLLAVSMIANLTFLGFFKYFNFFVDQFAALLIALGFEPHMPTLRVVLPVGISFYTFQTMSYVIDVYRGRLKPCTSLLDFATFIAYFPPLVAGPIERAEHLLPQITGSRRYKAGDFEEGLYHVLLGLFKKVVIADNVAPIVNHSFDMPAIFVAGMVMLGVMRWSSRDGISPVIVYGAGIQVARITPLDFKQQYSQYPSEFWQRGY